jgi:hypothetical protein
MDGPNTSTRRHLSRFCVCQQRKKAVRKLPPGQLDQQSLDDAKSRYSLGNKRRACHGAQLNNGVPRCLWRSRMVVQSIASVGEATLSNGSVKVKPARGINHHLWGLKVQPALPSPTINSPSNMTVFQSDIRDFRRFHPGIGRTLYPPKFDSQDLIAMWG